MYGKNINKQIFMFLAHVKVSDDDMMYKVEGKHQGVHANTQVTPRGCTKLHCEEDQRPRVLV